MTYPYDPFGTTIPERLMRRVAGVGVSAVVIGGLISLLGEDRLGIIGIVSTSAALFGIPASWFAAPRFGWPLITHFWLGGAVGLLIALAIWLRFGDADYLAIYSIIFVLFGPFVSLVAAWVGLRLPRSLVMPFGVVAGIGILALIPMTLAPWIGA